MFDKLGLEQTQGGCFRSGANPGLGFSEFGLLISESYDV